MAESSGESSSSVGSSYGMDERVILLFPRFLSCVQNPGNIKYIYSKSSCSTCGEKPADPSTLIALDKIFQENYADAVEILIRIILPTRAGAMKNVGACSQIFNCEKCAGKLRRLIVLFHRMRQMEEEFSELRKSVGSGLLEASAEALGVSVAQTQKAVTKWNTSTKKNSRYFPHRVPLHRPNETVKVTPTAVSDGPKRRGRRPKRTATELPVCVRCSVRLWTDPKPHSKISSETSPSPQKKKPSTKQSSSKDVQQSSVSFVNQKKDPKIIRFKPRVVVKKISDAPNSGTSTSEATASSSSTLTKMDTGH